MQFLVLLVIASVAYVSADPMAATLPTDAGTDANANVKLPAGIADLLAATPTMLSSVSTPLRTATSVIDTTTDRRKANTVTISGSTITFAKTAKPKLVQVVESLISNSPPGPEGDRVVMHTIMSVLNIDESDTAAIKQIELTLNDREHKEMLRKSIEALIDMTTDTNEPQ